MHFELLESWPELHRGADDLLRQAEKTSLFLSRPWFENLVATTLDEGQSVLLACVVEDESVLVILPLLRYSENDWGSLTRSSSTHFSLIIAERDQNAIVDCLADGLAGLPITFFRLESFAADDPAIGLLQAALESRGFECHRNMRFYNWIHRSDNETFAQYLAARHSRIRNTIARKARKLDREAGIRICIYTDDDIDRALTDYDSVYRASWKASEANRAFTPGLVRAFADKGWLRLGVLYAGDQPVAAQIWFVAYGKASIFRLVFDDAWRNYSPGSVLMQHMMQHAMEQDGAREIDFLNGNERYKQDWMTERRERWALDCARRPEKETAQRKRIKRLAAWFRR